MLQALVLTAVVAALAWYFLMRKDGRKRPQEQPSKTQLKKQAKTSKDSKEAAHIESNTQSSQSASHAQTAATSKKPKNKVEHPYFFKSFKKNESAIVDFDISRDNQFLAIASKDRAHVLYNIKKDSIFKFTSNTIPQAVAVSERGSYVVLALENKVSVFKADSEKVVQTKEFVVSKEHLLNVTALEEQDLLIAAGSGRQCNYFIHTLGGALVKMVRSDVNEATGIKFDRQRGRSVYFSGSMDIRVFAPQLTAKREFKEYSKEHLICGHKNAVVSGCFNPKGTEFFSLSLDRTLKHWDTSCEGFQGNHVACLDTWQIDPSLVSQDSIIEWVGAIGEGKEEVNYICLAHGSALYFFACSQKGIKLVEKIEDAHLGETVTKMTYVAHEKDQSKGVLFTKSEKKLFSWKPKLE